MLEDAGGIRRVILACGFVDLRKGIDGLAQVIGSQYNLNPFEKGTLFLFCGRVKVKSFAPRQIQRRLLAALVTLSRKVF